MVEAGEILVRHGLISAEQLEIVRREQKLPGDAVERAVELGFVDEEDALKALGVEVGLDYVDLTTADIDLSLLKTLPQRLIYRQSLFPLQRNNGSVIVATSDPFDLYPLDEVAAVTGLSVVPVLAARSEIAKLIKANLGVGGETVEGLLALKEEESGDEVELLDDIESDGSELSEMAQEASVVRLVNEIMLEAIESRASDIHIESQGNGLVVRYRIDGMLHSQPVPPEINYFQAAIISRLKIMARLNIAEKRLPQDGRIKLKVRGREIDIRVSMIPMIHGESIVMRVLDKGSLTFDLRTLGMDDDVYQQFKQIISLPHGIILVTGPTGSGKTTTLYSSLLEIQDEATKIITTEDPVEYQLDGINQIQVHPKIGLTFAASLRSILRHDPDVVLVGEIRDKETAENAVQASLTGHLVFSTLHTNDAAGAFARMIDMGVEPFLIASTVEGVMAQRLVRKLCPHCKTSYVPKRSDLPSDFPWDEFIAKGGELSQPAGCRQCRGVGYRGRMGIYELLITTEEIRELAHEGLSTHKIKQAAQKNGMLTLRQYGWRKALSGETSVEEILRVTKGDV
ncbi:GspE/PulE family protein [Blastopirellula sp. JC732]|uniref:GspE/PulE family protein n=1 Tax=Blastopirellula sediminis TaxID=2894196 RepID=A0A9X1SE95_9BACT|nr:GspE/PulE family protein [Blastopirellula sediminis]MCC9608224.1 GspE/PulE family protein [Blastopirellula sediminis]MCC9626983.1 GspE/PulE family protein [Blastopirellula sediminis]